MASFDVVVVGLGAMGSAATYQLARRGVRVAAIDQFHPPHPSGSTHGESRVTRLAVGEGDQYVGLVRRSHQLWREIEADTGADLLNENGCLIIGPAGGGAAIHGVSDFLGATVRVARTHQIGHELLDESAMRDRYPEFRLQGGESAYYEPGGGFVRPGAAVAAQLDLAARHGAVLRFGERVEGWSAPGPIGAGVVVRTPVEHYHADTLIVTAGPWTTALLGPSAGPLTVTRQVNYWFRPVAGAAGRFVPDHFPVFIWQHGTAPADFFYGIPALGPDGVKVGSEDRSQPVTPDGVDRRVTPEECDRMAARHLRPHLPSLDGPCTRASVCLYTESPDRGFVIDRHPEHRQVIIASPCSGHGFKHSAAIGEALAQLALDGICDADVARFSLARFSDSAGGVT